MQKRCPWCGKKIKINRWNKLRRKTPSRFIFEKCEFCAQYYGQNFRSLRVFFLCLGMLFSSFLSLLWYPLISLAIPIVFLLSMLVIQMPLERMTQDETVQKVSRPIFRAKILSNNFRIREKYIYAQTGDFDFIKVYSSVSPIYVTRIYKKEGEISFYFLYDHEKNMFLPTISLYDGETKIAEIKIYDKA